MATSKGEIDSSTRSWAHTHRSGGTPPAGAAFLAEASRLLADSLDYERTLATVARLALPYLGAWCIVDLVEEDGSARRLAIVHPDPEKQPLVRRLESGWPPQRDDPLGVPVVMRTQRSEIVPEVTNGLLRRVARNQRNLDTLRQLGIGSLMVVPLVARGEVLGAMTFVGPATGHRYGMADLELAEDLAARAAIAIDNARLYRQARRASAAAEEASHAKSHFLAVTSHEIRTPINAIIGYTQLLEMGIKGPLNQEQRMLLERIQASSQYLLGLLNQVLDISRAEVGQLTVQQEIADLREAVDAAVAIAQPQAVARSIGIDHQCNVSASYVGDPIRVRQILVNLLANGCKFTPPGGHVVVRCEQVERTEVAEHGTASGPWLRVDVEDNGDGIPADKLEAIFEPFVQVDSELTRRAGGSGLGLTISRRLARLMGGDITVTSTPGNGSCFSLWLPVPTPGTHSVRRPESQVGREHLRLMGDLIMRRIVAIADRYVGELRRDSQIPAAGALTDADLRDNVYHLLACIAGALLTCAQPQADDGALQDGSSIQRVIAELHGAQRHRLGWSEAALRSDYEALARALEQEVRQEWPGSGMERALGIVRSTVERLLRLSARGWSVAHSAQPGRDATG